MLPRKTGKPIAIKCTEEFRQQTETIADSLGKSLSDYCRIAIENYNKHYQNNVPVDNKENYQISHESKKEYLDEMRAYKNNTASKPEFKSFPKGGK
jgi:predicted DNA-binding protein